MQTEDVARFDRWSGHYDRAWLQAPFFDRVHRHVIGVAAGLTPAPAAIIDVGCGTGRLLEKFRARFPNASLTGVDAAPGMVRMARAKGLPAVVAAAENLPLPTGAFDLAVSTISFHHWANQGTGLAEVRRILAPGGRLLLADVYVTAWLKPVFSVIGVRDRFHTGAELDSMFGAAGFEPAGRTTVPVTGGTVAVSVAAA